MVWTHDTNNKQIIVLFFNKERGGGGHIHIKNTERIYSVKYRLEWNTYLLVVSPLQNIALQ